VSLADKRMSVEHQWNDSDRGENSSTGRKTSLSATLYTKDLTWTDRGLNLDSSVRN